MNQSLSYGIKGDDNGRYHYRGWKVDSTGGLLLSC